MVLSRILLAVLLLAGCKQSLFDSHNGDDTGGDGGNGSGDGSVPSSCPATCIADAAADFGMAKWGYLDDNRNRSWTPMTAAMNGYNGADANRFSSCKNDSSAKACDALPGALLVNTSAPTGTADPALSYTSTMNQVVQLTVRVHVPVGATTHTVRLYRNAREDVLFTAAAAPGQTFEKAITLDALKDDRFYLAIAATDAAAQLIGVHFYINATGASFPASCKLALQFSAAAGTGVANSCGAAYTYYDYNMTPAQTPTLAAGPIPEMGMGADIPMDKYYEGNEVLTRSGDTTTQLWLRHDAFVSTYNPVAFSDEDLDVGGGVAVYILNQAAPRIGAETCTNGNPLEFKYGDAPFPGDHAWHFVRVVHAADTVLICVDGSRVASYPLPAGKMQSNYHPYVARNVIWTPSGAFFDGGIDDVRVVAGALPCELP